MFKIFKNSIIWSLFFVFNSVAIAQEGSISGKVVSQSGTPIEDVSIFLTNTKWALTSVDGTFEIDDVPFGNYTLKTSRVGFVPRDLEVEINSSSKSIEITLEERIYGDILAVVTASRTAQYLEDVPAPIEVISEQEIQLSGATTLKDILLEQPGISLAPNEENAIQLQGFESDYTLILIDGQPVIGRTRGALDLSRINVANIQQVEVVKGPSSALWGSDALAGVINIITKKSTEPLSVSSYAQYGSRNSYDAGSSISFLQNKLSGSVGFSANGSDGFDLSDSQFGNNQNPFDAVTLNSKFDYHFSDLTTLTFSGRYFRNNFSGPTLATVQNQVIEIEESGWQDDASLQARLETSPFSNFKTTLIGYSTRYEDQSDTNFEDPTEDDIRLNNRQGLDRFELQNDYSWNASNITTFGGGSSWEFVRAERYQGKRTQSGNFAFLQHQLFVGDKLYFIAGARLDNHSSYESYLSPKLAARFSLTDEINFRASVGQGFKAPDFRTLYLNFDNAGSGYRIFGAENILAEIDDFTQQGLFQRSLIDISRLGELEPEYSTAYNLGVNFRYEEHALSWTLNFFRNDAQNLIDAREVVELTDGSTIFGYLNINKARTEGLEFETTYSPFTRFTASIGYQYLNAVELLTEERTVIENGRVVTKDFETEIPLPKRPKHSGNLKLFYKEPFFNSEISLRGILRGQYFFNDNNGDGVANEEDDDFVDAHSIWNLTITKNLNSQLRLQFGVNNLLNHTDEEFLQAQPGTTFFSRLFIEL